MRRIFMKLRIILLIILMGTGYLHAMQKEVTIDKKTQKQIDTFVSKGELEELKTLLTGLKGNSNDAYKAALEKAVVEQKYSITDWLLKNGADINTIYGGGNTPLHIAAENKNTALVSLLLDKGASIDAKNKYGLTPLVIATSRGNKQVAALLQEAKLNKEHAQKAQLAKEQRKKEFEQVTTLQRLEPYSTRIQQTPEQLLLLGREKYTEVKPSETQIIKKQTIVEPITKIEPKAPGSGKLEKRSRFNIFSRSSK